MMHFDVGAFVGRVKDMDRLRIVAEAVRRLAALKGAVKARAEGSTDYAETLKGLVWFLEQGGSPSASTLPCSKSSGRSARSLWRRSR